ncbi:MAG: hypothetical protein RLZZ263_1029 [Cyanobacteriota bacterium]
MALPLVVGQGLDFGLACKEVQSFRFRLTAHQGPGASPENNPAERLEPRASGIWNFSEDRLADLGALLVFRHWLRSQLQDQAEAQAAQLERQVSAVELEEPRYGRLFF